jgi:hypothetical protein
MQKAEKKTRKKFLFLFLPFLVLALLLFAIGVFSSSSSTGDASPPIIAAEGLFPGSGEADEGYLTHMTPDEVMEQMQRFVDASYFSFKINARPIFETGASAGTLQIENPSYNVYPMVVQVFEDKTGDMLYDSGGILPNHHIDTAKLLKTLPAGKYPATATLNVYDPETLVWQGKQEVALIITVKK